MKRGWRIVLNVITLLAFFASVVLIVFTLFLQTVALEHPLTVPGDAQYQLILNDLHQEIDWRLRTVEPGEPTADSLRRYAFRWSREEPWQNPANPALADTLNVIMGNWITFDRDSLIFNNPQFFGNDRWTAVFQLYAVDGDTIADGAVTPRTALMDHYLPAWIDHYMTYSAPTGKLLRLLADYHPVQLVLKPNKSTLDTVLLVQGTTEMVYQGRVIPEDERQQLMLETDELVPGLGWLKLRGPGLSDKAVAAGTKQLLYVIIALWAITLAGLLWIITLNERARQMGHVAEKST